ncbi:hypothetical protein PTI98_007268 [Pleurotus ostreatus]|nr:hypothetical protein PTI98_007268 [Pleurotus ostreatus]
MHECGYHPQAVLATQESDDFPSPNLLVHARLVPIAIKMFGDMVMSGDILIDNAIAPNFKTLLVHNVTHMGKAHSRAKSVIDKKVEVMHSALKAVDEAGEKGVSLASIRAAMQASKDIKHLAAWYLNMQKHKPDCSMMTMMLKKIVALPIKTIFLHHDFTVLRHCVHHVEWS